ncbi:hypothetical protein ARD30_00860 [Bosea thiooxidans]|uniref:Core-binding (CB) domain-containing protein n=1 Tax=Bosea thiooxidans TaxID=53254 RepID=A0A0Q3L6L0_9HYPH|nr:hypothetical protein ARD30_00860 [Bosea thiooxidans]
MRSPEPLRRRAGRAVPAHLLPKAKEAVPARLPVIFGVVEQPDRLLVRFRDATCAGGVQEIDLSNWLVRRDIGLAVAEYLSTKGLLARSTRQGIAKLLNPFLAFLLEGSSVETLADIDADAIARFEAWLNTGESDGTPWSGLTKTQRYRAVADLFDHLRSSPRGAPIRDRDFGFRRNPWPLNHRQVRPREAVSHLDLSLIRRACIDDIAETVARMEIADRAELMSPDRLPSPGARSVTPYRDPVVRLAALVQRYDSRIPARDLLAASDYGLARSMVSPYGSYAEVASALHLSPRAIVPFALLLAIDGAFNPEGLLTLEWHDVERSHPLFGEARWRVGARKARAKRKHYRSFAAGLSAPEAPVNLLRTLERLTRFTRRHVDERHRDRVFVFWTPRAETYGGFDAGEGAAGDGFWHRGLATFIADYGLPAFTMSMMRKTASDLVDIASGGDIKANQVLLGHATVSTTHRSYETSTMRERGREALATAMAWRERFVATGGRADTRNGFLDAGRGSAATPGFSCFEPLFSPLPGQRDGQACTAYGQCPACPLACVDVGDPKVFLRLSQLAAQMEVARSRVHPVRWMDVWLPQAEALRSVWLPRFPAATVHKASSVTLPPLPDLE